MDFTVVKSAKGPYRVEKKGLMFAVCDTYGVCCVETSKGKPSLFDTEEQATDVGRYLGLLFNKVLEVSFANNPYLNPHASGIGNLGNQQKVPRPQTVTGRIAGSVGQQQSIPAPVLPSSGRYKYEPARHVYLDIVTGRIYDAYAYGLDANGDITLLPTHRSGSPDPYMQQGKKYVVTSNGLVPKELSGDDTTGSDF